MFYPFPKDNIIWKDKIKWKKLLSVFTVLLFRLGGSGLIGSRMTPHIMGITNTEIIGKNSFYDDEEKISLKLRLKYDDSFVVTFSSLPDYPVGLTLSYLRG